MKNAKRIALLTALCSLLLVMSMLMSSCGIATLMTLLATSKPEEVTTTTTDKDSENPDTNETPDNEKPNDEKPNDEKPESIKDKIVSAIDKLSEVSYVKIPASVEMKQSVSGSSSTNTEEMTVILSKDDKNHKFLLSMYQGNYYMHSYLDGTDMYGAYKDDYVDEETGEESPVEYYHSATNKKMTFRELMQYSEVDSEMFMLAVFGNEFLQKISALAESTENIELTTNEDGVTKIVIPTDAATAIGLIEEVDASDVPEFANEDCSLTFEISSDGLLKAFLVKVSYTDKGKSTMAVTFSAEYTDVRQNAEFKAPEWLDKAKNEEIESYTYYTDNCSLYFSLEYYEGSEFAYLSEIFTFPGTDKIELVEIPESVNGKPVTYISGFCFDNVDGIIDAVILPDSVYLNSDSFREVYNTKIFTNQERPENCYVNSVYYSGEWEMKSQKPTPTRDVVVDPYAPKVTIDNRRAWYYYMTTDPDTFISTNPNWYAKNFDHSAWNNDGDFTSTRNITLFMRSTFYLTADDLSNLNSNEVSLYLDIDHIGETHVYINGELVLVIGADVDDWMGTNSYYLDHYSDEYVYNGNIADILSTENTIAVLSLDDGKFFTFEMYTDRSYYEPEPDYPEPEVPQGSVKATIEDSSNWHYFMTSDPDTFLNEFPYWYDPYYGIDGAWNNDGGFVWNYDQSLFMRSDFTLTDDELWALSYGDAYLYFEVDHIGETYIFINGTLVLVIDPDNNDWNGTLTYYLDEYTYEYVYDGNIADILWYDNMIAVASLYNGKFYTLDLNIGYYDMPEVVYPAN